MGSTSCSIIRLSQGNLESYKSKRCFDQLPTCNRRKNPVSTHRGFICLDQKSYLLFLRENYTAVIAIVITSFISVANAPYAKAQEQTFEFYQEKDFEIMM